MKDKYITQQLLDAGFTQELRLWSFAPKLSYGDSAYYYSKYVVEETEDSYKDIEIGVVIDGVRNLMEVYICDCVVGCCGKPYGIHPFSLKKINKLLETYKEDYE